MIREALISMVTLYGITFYGGGGGVPRLHEDAGAANNGSDLDGALLPNLDGALLPNLAGADLATL